MAKFYLAECYHYGRGVVQNYAEAVSWYRKTSSSALSGGLIGLATFYEASVLEQHGAELGYGPAETRREAIRLYRKAAKWNEDARKALQRLGVPTEAVLIAGWGEVHDPDGDCSIEDAGTRVTIQVPAGRHDLYSRNADPTERENAPRVMQEVAGDFVAQVKVTADWKLRTPLPNEQNTFAAGLAIVASPQHFLRHERILFRHRQFGTTSSFIPPIYDLNGQRLSTIEVVGADYFQGRSTWLRMVRRGQNVSTFISHDGVQWQPTGVVTTQLPNIVKVGVHAINAAGSPYIVEFENYELHGPDQ